MGVVSILDLKQVDYSDYHVVRNMILLRSEFMFRANNQQDVRFLAYSLSSFDYEFKELVHSMYRELDELISLCDFSEKNLVVLTLLSNGHDFNEVAQRMNVQSKTIFNRLKRMTIKINNVAGARRAYENYND